MGKGLRIFLMFLILLGPSLVLIDDMGYYDSAFTYGFILSVSMSVMAIYFWDYINELMSESTSIVWKVFKGMVEIAGWLLSLAVIIFLVIGVVLESTVSGFFSWDVLWVMLAIWGVGSIVSAINSLKKDSK